MIRCSISGGCCYLLASTNPILINADLALAVLEEQGWPTAVNPRPRPTRTGRGPPHRPVEPSVCGTGLFQTSPSSPRWHLVEILPGSVLAEVSDADESNRHRPARTTALGTRVLQTLEAQISRARSAARRRGYARRADQEPQRVVCTPHDQP